MFLALAAFLMTGLFCFAEGIVPKGVTATENFVGCMRKLVSKGGKPKKLLLSNPLMMEGNVYLGGCPYKNVEPLLP